MRMGVVLVAATLSACGGQQVRMDGAVAAGPGGCPAPALPATAQSQTFKCDRTLSNCWVNVVVLREPAPSCKLFAKVDAEAVQMANKHAATIWWVLVNPHDRFELRAGPPGQEYSGGSVFFKGANAAAAPSQLTAPALYDDPRVPSLRGALYSSNANSSTVTLEYGVRVYDKRPPTPGEHPQPIDPAIINDAN